MTNDEALGLLDDLDDPDEVHLTDWEIVFIDSLMQWIESGRTLTPKQNDTLYRIHAEKGTK